MAVDNLPTDVETLKSLLIEALKEKQLLRQEYDSLTQQKNTLYQEKNVLHAEKDSLHQENNTLYQETEALHNTIANLQTLINLYQAEKRLAIARQFAASSEKDPLQIPLFNEAEYGADVAVESDTESPATQVKSHARRGGRKPLPDNLPRIEIIHDLTNEEKQCACGCIKEKIGEDILEQLDIIPAVVRVLKHIRLKYVCQHCESPPETASMPAQPIPKSQVSPGFLAYVITSKYADGLPLYRQCHILKRSGIDYARNTLCQQVVNVGELVQPLINLMQEKALEYPVLQMDETTVQVLNEPGKTAQSKSYMWVMRGGPPSQSSIIFHYDPGRGQAVPQRLLMDYEGYLQTDAWHAYDAVHSNKVIAVGCFAHARRKFKDAQKALPKAQQTKTGKIQQALAFIQKLYAIEKQIKEKVPETKQQIRQEESLPVLKKFKNWLNKQNVNPKSKLGEAIAYTLKYWSRLIVYCDDGRVEIDNNGVENKIRPFAIGRKNWLFSASQAGATASANLYSLIETAKANGLNEYDYLKWIFTKLPTAATVESIEMLLPWNIDRTELVNYVRA